MFGSGVYGTTSRASLAWFDFLKYGKKKNLKYRNQLRKVEALKVFPLINEIFYLNLWYFIKSHFKNIIQR